MNNLVPRIKGFLKGLFVFLIFYLVFMIVLFPGSDLGFLVSSMVSQNSRGSVNLNFDDMSFSPLPSVSSSFENVRLQVKGMPTLNADRLSFSASPLGLIFLGLGMPSEPGPNAQDDLMKAVASNLSANIEAESLFGGDLSLELSSGKKSTEGNPQQKIELETSDIQLPQILKDMGVSFPLKSGELGLESELEVDYTFASQPVGDFNMTIGKLVIPPEPVETPAGPLILPEVNVSNIAATGDIKDGIIRFTKVDIGKGKDNLKGSVNGTLAMTLRKRGTKIAPVIGAYDFNVDLLMSPELHSEAELLFLLVSQYKELQVDGWVRYAFRVQGSSFQSNPRFSNYRQ